MKQILEGGYGVKEIIMHQLIELFSHKSEDDYHDLAQTKSFSIEIYS